MGTILKYIFYIALIIIIYLVGKGIFEGSINAVSYTHLTLPTNSRV